MVFLFDGFFKREMMLSNHRECLGDTQGQVEALRRCFQPPRCGRVFLGLFSKIRVVLLDVVVQRLAVVPDVTSRIIELLRLEWTSTMTKCDRQSTATTPCPQGHILWVCFPCPEGCQCLPGEQHVGFVHPERNG